MVYMTVLLDTYMDVGAMAMHDSREGGGTRPWMVEGTRLWMIEGTRLWMVEGRTMQELLSRAKHDSREGGGRAKQDA
jgi:hypothetical protein